MFDPAIAPAHGLTRDERFILKMEKFNIRKDFGSTKAL